MGWSKSGWSCADARSVDMVDYLTKLGFIPTKIRDDNYWYHSPFRNDRTPSFKVNRKINRWYDFGEGCGGSIIDFAIRYNNCTIAEFLKSLELNYIDLVSPHQARPVASNLSQNEDRIQVTKIGLLSSYGLINYLSQRRITISIADNYCKQVGYTTGNKNYHAIGFVNNSAGWELRNPYFKGSSSPKDFTLLNPGKPILCVFEGFMDFLSFLVVIPEAQESYSFLVLNSLAFFEKAKPLMETYDSIWLFLDNDAPGRNCCLYAQSISSRYLDKSSLYQKYKDLNEWLCFPGNRAINFLSEQSPP